MALRHLAICMAVGAACLVGAALAQPVPDAPPAADASDDVAVPAPQRPDTAAQKLADARSADQKRRDDRAFQRCLLAMQERQSRSTSFDPWQEDPLTACQKRTSMQNGAAVPTAR